MTSRECETCIKRKTVYCPTSIDCMATDDMPYYQNIIMLLEENQDTYKDVRIEIKEYKNQQKEFINYLEDEINKLVKEYGNYVYDDYSEEKGKYDSYQEILQKYKEIIGVSDENKRN